MPLVSHFYGVLIRMFFKDTDKHNKPHFHAVYNEFSASYSLDGELLSGSMPSKQQKLIIAWATLRQDELFALWRILQENGEYFSIKGLE